MACKVVVAADATSTCGLGCEQGNASGGHSGADVQVGIDMGIDMDMGMGMGMGTQIETETEMEVEMAIWTGMCVRVMSGQGSRVTSNKGVAPTQECHIGVD